MPRPKSTQRLREAMLAHQGYDPTQQAGMNRAERRAAEFALRKMGIREEIASKLPAPATPEGEQK